MNKFLTWVGAVSIGIVVGTVLNVYLLGGYVEFKQAPLITWIPSVHFTLGNK